MSIKLISFISASLIFSNLAQAKNVSQVGCEIQVPAANPSEIWPTIANLQFDLNTNNQDTNRSVKLPNGDLLQMSISKDGTAKDSLFLNVELYRTGEAMPVFSEMGQMSRTAPFLLLETKTHSIRCH